MAVPKEVHILSTVSETYTAEYYSLMTAYAADQAALDKKWGAMIGKLDTKEIALQAGPPIPIGTRVWSYNYRRAGTIMSAHAIVCNISDDYYSDRVGPGQYQEVDPVWDRTRLCIQWRYACETDPSPKRGNVGTWSTSKPAVMK